MLRETCVHSIFSNGLSQEVSLGTQSVWKWSFHQITTDMFKYKVRNSWNEKLMTNVLEINYYVKYFYSIMKLWLHTTTKW